MSSDVTAPPDPAAEAPTEPSPAKKKSNTRATVLIIILIIAAAALFFDKRAQSQAMSHSEGLDAMKAEAMKSPSKELPTMEEVREYVGREPDEAYDHKEVPNTKVEEYHYRVPWRTTTLYVYYRTQPDVRFDAVSVNQELTAEDL